MSKKTLIHEGNYISLYKQLVPLEGNRHTFYDIVSHPGGSVMAAINDDGKLCLITQSRPAVDSVIWEFPAGCLEPNELPLVTAKRELEEEIGFVGNEWYELGSIVTAPGFCNEILYLFVVRDLTKTSTNFDEEEQIEAHWLTTQEIDEKINAGEINDAKTLSLLYRIRTHDQFSALWNE